MTLPLIEAWRERAKLWAEGEKLRAEGAKLWAEAIIALYGNVKISWGWDDPIGKCMLENGDVYDASVLENESVN